MYASIDLCNIYIALGGCVLQGHMHTHSVTSVCKDQFVPKVCTQTPLLAYKLHESFSIFGNITLYNVSKC